ncbi:MAG TPA: hypothetical protein VGJ84_03885 [Polyangiaceae bacterium]|jgi:TPR repeat protein
MISARTMPWMAISVSVLFGGAAGWIDVHRELRSRVAAPATTRPQKPKASAPGSPVAAPSAKPSDAAESVANAPPSSTTPEASDAGAPLPEALQSPHELAISSEAALRRAEIRCDRLLPEECARLADAYERGEVAEKDPERVRRYRKVTLTLYVRRCQSGDPVSCFQLSRMYREGDVVSPDSTSARALSERAQELCKGKTDEACEYIRRNGQGIRG